MNDISEVYEQFFLKDIINLPNKSLVVVTGVVVSLLDKEKFTSFLRSY